MSRLQDERGIRVEDAICGAACIVAERCIDAAGDFPLRDHEFAPGQRVLSQRVNELLCGDVGGDDVSQVPGHSIYGIIIEEVDGRTYYREHFPRMGSIFSGFVAGIGETKPENWGRVPVSVTKDHHPWILPLRFAYETRDEVDRILAPIAADKLRCLRVATGSLVDLLNKISGVLAANIALRLAFEVINGMAKTAPMTRKAILAAQAKQPSVS